MIFETEEELNFFIKKRRMKRTKRGKKKRQRIEFRVESTEAIASEVPLSTF